MKLDVQCLRVVPQDFRLKGIAVVGQSAYERVAQAGQIGGGKTSVARALLCAAAVDRATENLFGPLGPQLLPQFVVDQII